MSLTESILTSLGQMSLAGGVMIAAVIAARALFRRRLPKGTFILLWYAALARLLLPWKIPCQLSVYTLFARLNAIPVGEPEPVPVSVPAAAPAAPVTAPAAAAITLPAVYAPAQPVPAPSAAISGETVALLVWLLGALACAAFFAVVYVRLRRQFSQSLPLESDYVRRWLDGHRIWRRISLRQSDRIGAPLTYGVLRPVILMPKSADWDDGQAVKCVLEHEYVHIRHFDAAGKLLLTAAVCLHWFNPLAWCMYVLANRDLELACDEAVLRRLGQEARSAYAMALIRMAGAESGPAPLYSGFGKNAVEERITAIMKTKKTSLAALLVAAGLVLGVTTVFATSAAAEDRQARDKASSGVQRATAVDTLLSYTDADGKTRYSEDGGKTWVSEEEYSALHPKTDVVWWTYDEYAAWLENEKAELQAMLGERGWTQSRGEFVWTQREIDRTIAWYEAILEDIGRGALVSKTVNGSGDVMLMQGVGGVGSLSEGEPTAADFAEYAPYGLEWKEKEKALFYKGERVRYFLDGTFIDDSGGMAIRFEYADAQLAGDIDVRAVRRRVDNADGSFDPMGPLTGLEKFSQAEYDANTFRVPELEAVTYSSQELDRDRRETEALLKVYAPLGLSWEVGEADDELSLSMSYNGKPVHSIFDAQTGVWIANNQNGWSLGPDAVELEAVYENGKLTGLKASPAPSAETAAVASVNPGTEATTAVITQGTGTGKAELGVTFAEKFARYESIQIVYEEAEGASGKGNVYRLGGVGFKGKRDRYLISHFVDVSPDGSVFTFDSADSGGLSVQTVYDETGELARLTVTASPVTAEPLKNGEEVVGVNGLIYSHGWTSYGYVRATDFDPNGGLVPLYDAYCNVIGCFNNADSIEHDTSKAPNKVLVDGYICIRAVGTGFDGSYPVSGYIRDIDHNPDIGDTPEEVGEYLKNHPDYGKKEHYIPLYDGSGKEIGTFRISPSIALPSNINSIDEAKDYLKNLGS